MALRLPIPTQSVRRASRLRRVLTIAFASSVFVLLPLRVMLAIGGIATWTTAWTTVELLTLPFVAPLALIRPLDTTMLGNATAAELLALIVYSAVAVYCLALLTVRRQR